MASAAPSAEWCGLSSRVVWSLGQLWFRRHSGSQTTGQPPGQVWSQKVKRVQRGRIWSFHWVYMDFSFDRFFTQKVIYRSTSSTAKKWYTLVLKFIIDFVLSLALMPSAKSQWQKSSSLVLPVQEQNKNVEMNLKSILMRLVLMIGKIRRIWMTNIFVILTRLVLMTVLRREIKREEHIMVVLVPRATDEWLNGVPVGILYLAFAPHCIAAPTLYREAIRSNAMHTRLCISTLPSCIDLFLSRGG